MEYMAYGVHMVGKTGMDLIKLENGNDRTVNRTGSGACPEHRMSIHEIFTRYFFCGRPGLV